MRRSSHTCLGSAHIGSGNSDLNSEPVCNRRHNDGCARNSCAERDKHDSRLDSGSLRSNS